MEWFSQNWVWVLFFAAFIALHLFGHGGHGGHGSSHNAPKPASKESVQRTSEKESGHQH